MSTQELMKAINKGSIEDVKRLIKKGFFKRGVDINAKDSEGNTPLIRAINNENTEENTEMNPEIVKLLIEKGADVNAIDNNGNTPLILAVNTNYNEIVKLLIKKGADVNAKNRYGHTPLMNAIYNENTEENPEIVKLLIEKGADVNVRSYSQTVLHVAVSRGYTEIIELLIEKGADVNAISNFDETVLMTAVSRGYNTEIIKLLIEKGADVNAKNNKGKTALMIAVVGRNIEIIELLIEKGANLNARDKSRRTALMIAQSEGYNYIIRLLKSSNPKPKVKKGPWKGMTQSDIVQLDTIFAEDALDYSICPICLQFQNREFGCIYMYHNCTESGKPYHERLYELYKDDKGVIHWCTICNRIADDGHKHYKLNHAWTTDPSIIEVRIYSFDQYNDKDCSVSWGGGGPNEKLARFRRFREYALKLQEDVGKKDSQEAFEQLVEEVWNAPLEKENNVLKKIMNNKAWNIPSSAFPLPIVNANNNSPNIPYNGPLPNKINSGHNNVTMNDNVPIIRFVHKQPNGLEKTHGISQEGLEDFIKSKIGEFGDGVAGYCFMYPDCKVRLYPQEIKDYISEDLYNTYKKKFNNKFKNFSGGGSENLIQEAEDAQCVVIRKNTTSKRNNRNNRNSRIRTKRKNVSL